MVALYAFLQGEDLSKPATLLKRNRSSTFESFLNPSGPTSLMSPIEEKPAKNLGVANMPSNGRPRKPTLPSTVDKSSDNLSDDAFGSMSTPPSSPTGNTAGRGRRLSRQSSYRQVSLV